VVLTHLRFSRNAVLIPKALGYKPSTLNAKPGALTPPRHMRCMRSHLLLLLLWISGIGYRVSGSDCRCRISGFGFRDKGLGFLILWCGFQVSGIGCWVSECGIRISGFGLRDFCFGSWVPDFGSRISGFGFRVLGVGFRVSGIGFRISVSDLGSHSAVFHLEHASFLFTKSPEDIIL